jgi:hypothetical protein
MKYYAVGKKVSQMYGHGDTSTEVHICPKNAYMGDMKTFHPLFKTKEEALQYIESIEFGYDLLPVELFLNIPNEEI